MDLHGLTEAQLDLAFFAMNQATNAAKSTGTHLPFAVVDRDRGRELTWLEDASHATSLDHGRLMAVVSHSVVDSSGNGSEVTPALFVELVSAGSDDGLSDGEHIATIVQPYRPGGPHRRFATLGDPFSLESQTV